MPLSENEIYQGRCEDLILQLPNNYVDLVVTSPPYNVDLGNNKYNKNTYDVYADNIDYREYIEWLEHVFYLLKQKMVHGGRVCINVGDKENGGVPTHSDITQFMTKKLKYLPKSTIIWKKNQIGNRTAWGSYKSPSNPSFPTPFEYILIFCNENQKKEGNNKGITVTDEEFIRNSLAIWSFAPETKMNKRFRHPAMFPEELPRRLIQQLTYKGDLVLDVFSGMGTTCLAAAKLKRRWMGFELSGDYVDRSRERLDIYLDQERIF